MPLTLLTVFNKEKNNYHRYVSQVSAAVKLHNSPKYQWHVYNSAIYFLLTCLWTNCGLGSGLSTATLSGYSNYSEHAFHLASV